MFLTLGNSNKSHSSERQTFKKSERLKSRNLIKQVLETGQSFTIPPFKAFYTQVKLEVDVSVQFGIGVPKKKIRKAHDRNRIKRLVSEAYRLNKSKLYDVLKEQNRQLALFVIYTGEVDPPFTEIESKINLILDRLKNDSAVHPKDA